MKVPWDHGRMPPLLPRVRARQLHQRRARGLAVAHDDTPARRVQHEAVRRARRRARARAHPCAVAARRRRRRFRTLFGRRALAPKDDQGSRGARVRARRTYFAVHRRARAQQSDSRAAVGRRGLKVKIRPIVSGI